MRRWQATGQATQLLTATVLVTGHMEKVEEEEEQLKGENAGGKKDIGEYLTMVTLI